MPVVSDDEVRASPDFSFDHQDGFGASAATAGSGAAGEGAGWGSTGLAVDTAAASAPLGSVGAGWAQRMWLGVLPQVAPNWSSYALLRFEINVRASAILGFVGSGGIGYDLKLAMQWGGGKYDQVVAIFLLLFAAIVLIDRLSDAARRRLVKGA